MRAREGHSPSLSFSFRMWTENCQEPQKQELLVFPRLNCSCTTENSALQGRGCSLKQRLVCTAQPPPH